MPPVPRARPKGQAKPPPKKRKRKKGRGGKHAGWRDRVARVWRFARAMPGALLIAILVLVLGAAAVAANAIHWTIRKPTGLLAPISNSLKKTPAQTWAAYDDLFRHYATPSISPELLAALAQIESSGNWAAQTYWRWDFNASDFFGIYRPASSSVGMYQMTEAAFTEARLYCIRNHAVVSASVVGADCGYEDSLSRVIPAQSIELTAVWLDRSVARILGGVGATAAQKRDLAAIIHLCGGSPARAFVRRGFRPGPGERCGDHDPAVYLAQVQAMEQQFRRLSER